MLTKYWQSWQVCFIHSNWCVQCILPILRPEWKNVYTLEYRKHIQKTRYLWPLEIVIYCDGRKVLLYVIISDYLTQLIKKTSTIALYIEIRDWWLHLVAFTSCFQWDIMFFFTHRDMWMYFFPSVTFLKHQ